jgi:hypothetical protein
MFSLSFTVTMSESYTFCPYKPKAHDPTLNYLKLSDAYDVTWTHATNSPSRLDEALAGNSKILEADVQMRYNRSDTEPIMAHPPDTESNLTLAEFVEKVIVSDKGMKLDFKTIMAVEPSLQLLKNISESKVIKNPIWLNSDILDGPCFDKVCVPVDSNMFIELCQQYFPVAVLSLGWTTGNEVKGAKNMYTWSHVINMGKQIYQISQPVTFAVRAALIKRSLEQLLWLLDLSRNLTLTVWSSDKDEVDAQDLVELRSKVYNNENVYYDLPKVQADAFKTALEGKNTNSGNPYQSQIKLKSYTTASCTDVLVGETKVMFTGKGGWVSSVDELTATGMESRHINLEVSFLPLDSQNSVQNITFVAGSNGLFGTNANLSDSDGVRLILQNTGEFKVTSPDGKVMKSSGNVPDPKSQYRISLWYGPSMDSIHFSVKSKADYQKEKSLHYEGGFKPSKKFIAIGVGEQQGGVLVNELSTAIALPSGSNSWKIIPCHFTIAVLVALLIGLFIHV